MDEKLVQHHKDIDIGAWQFRTGDWFTVRLYELMAHADEHNYALLAGAFPEAGAAFDWYMAGNWDEFQNRIPKVKEPTKGISPYPHPESKWTHPICLKDYAVMEPERDPFRVTDAAPERCCWCNEETTDGIYYRHDPDVVHPEAVAATK